MGRLGPGVGGGWLQSCGAIGVVRQLECRAQRVVCLLLSPPGLLPTSSSWCPSQALQLSRSALGACTCHRPPASVSLFSIKPPPSASQTQRAGGEEGLGPGGHGSILQWALCWGQGLSGWWVCPGLSQHLGRAWWLPRHQVLGRPRPKGSPRLRASGLHVASPTVQTQLVWAPAHRPPRPAVKLGLPGLGPLSTY